MAAEEKTPSLSNHAHNPFILYHIQRSHSIIPMIEQIPESWRRLLAGELQKDYIKELDRFVEDEYARGTCYPPKEEIFRAFRLCPPDRVRVVLIGQDPYHEAGQACGLCFSVSEGTKMPPSLKNIFKELHNDCGVELPSSGDLSGWGEQGVLLLNACLTVREHKAGSHARHGWERLTDAVISAINVHCAHVVFMLWGNYAISKAALIDQDKHLVLTSPHPSPLSAWQGFFGNHHFGRCNEYLIRHNYEPIDWGQTRPESEEGPAMRHRKTGTEPGIVQVGNVLLSIDCFEEDFACNLGLCRGACCIQGDAGAPITLDEVMAIEDILPVIEKALTTEAREVIRQQGIAYSDSNGELVTSLVNGKNCVFTCYDERGTCLCAIERAQRQGLTTTAKPVSCWLYPLRLRRFKNGMWGVNYHRWNICRSARREGRRLKWPLYRFLKEPLIKFFGPEWYAQLEATARLLKSEE